VGFHSDLGARLSEGPARPSAIYLACRTIPPAGRRHRHNPISERTTPHTSGPGFRLSPVQKTGCT
jgi:hypothetical protein